MTEENIRIGPRVVEVDEETGWVMESIPDNADGLRARAEFMCDTVEMVQRRARERIDIGDIEDSDEMFKRLCRNFLTGMYMDAQAENDAAGIKR